jgi:glycine cleavage system H protein
VYPSDIRYSKTHQWARVEGNTATVGITDYEQDQMGDLVYIELPETGNEVSEGDVIGSIESVKAVSDLQTPVSGAITQVNEALPDAPEKINQSPYGEGWIAKIEISDPSELGQLLDADAYREFVATL